VSKYQGVKGQRTKDGRQRTDSPQSIVHRKQKTDNRRRKTEIRLLTSGWHF